MVCVHHINIKVHVIMEEYSKDPFVTRILEGMEKYDQYVVSKGLILFKNKVFLVSESKVEEKILEAYHNAPMARHLELYKTYWQIRERFYWKCLKEDVLSYIRECTTCQRNKGERVSGEITTTTPHSETQIGKYLYGIHHQIS